MKYSIRLSILFLIMTCFGGCVSYDTKRNKESLIGDNMKNAEFLRIDNGVKSGCYQIFKLISKLEGREHTADERAKGIEERALPEKPHVFNFDMDKILGGRFNRFNDHWRKETSIIVLCYPINVLLDSLDIVDFHVGLGGTLLADAHATRALQAALGGGVKVDFSFFEDKRSPLAFAWDKTGIVAIGPIEALSTQGESTGIYGRYQYSYSFGGLSSPYNRHNQFYRDYWAIGAHVGAIADVGFDIHPTEILDLILGLGGKDIMNDSVLDRNRYSLTLDQRHDMMELLNAYSEDQLREKLNNDSPESFQIGKKSQWHTIIQWFKTRMSPNE